MSFVIAAFLVILVLVSWMLSPKLLLVALLALGVLGAIGQWRAQAQRKDASHLVKGDCKRTAGCDRLFVLVHGLSLGGRATGWQAQLPALTPHGDVLVVRYPAGVFTPLDAESAARGLDRLVHEHAGGYRHITIVAHSVGALVARKAVLRSAARVAAGAADWACALDRLVLLAGVNRGWDLSGRKPADMKILDFSMYWLLSWFGRLTDLGRVAMSTETGSPFVSDLRLQWMRWARSADPIARRLEVVQMLGDIDDVVSDEDNKDLVAMPGGNFVWLRVRGTGHLDILEMHPTPETGQDPYQDLRVYRYGKFSDAVQQKLDVLRQQSEEVPLGTDECVTDLVFIVHGIRDLGEWAGHFEQALRPIHEATGCPGKLAIASLRYGYFGMGQFLLARDRERYVRWFMDEYTEVVARYPNVQRIHFVGHSNGTYLLAQALKEYPSLKVDRVVLGGSVLPADWDWDCVFARGQVKALRNYVAADDWVVALFPRFFENRPMRWMNELGSAGFNGFCQGNDLEPRDHADGACARHVGPLQNVGFIRGQHGAMVQPDCIREISSFILTGDAATGACTARPRGGIVEGALKFASDWLTPVLWLLLAVVILYTGARVVSAGSHLAWPLLVAYVAMVMMILRSI